MADIKLVIKIPESMYEGVMIDRVLDTTIIRIRNEIKNGIPLPKGHRLMDADEFINSLKGIKRLHIDDELRSSILDAVNTNILVEADKAESVEE